MPKYHVVNLTDEQYELVQQFQEILEVGKQGPYGGYGGSVSKGEAVAKAVEMVMEPVRAEVERRAAIKRSVAAAKRQNNNPGITPGVSRK